MGNFWVSQTSRGVISLLTVNAGKVTSQKQVFTKLKNPHGLAVDPQDSTILYIAEETKISKTQVISNGALVAKPTLQKIADLPAGGRHFTRTLGFGPDDRLYVSIGSTCDVCEEKDPRHATIYSMKKDGSDFKLVSKGLRNSVFFTWSYLDGRMWATEMGRDNLGDNLPPDEINIIKEGGNYGWPICYGKNIHDDQFDKKTYIRNPCEEPTELPSTVDLPAHSAPLGLAFVPEEGWPQKYWYNLLVAYHGSWNRSEPTGYKVVRIILDDKGNYQGSEDFITGWLDEGDSIGRPVDILTQPGGIMYMTDDKSGVIYKVSYAHKVSDEELADLIKLDGIKAGDKVTSPLTITGQARGTWFFEASFPITLVDANGEELATAIAQAQSEWMTTDFVPFKADLSFPKPKTTSGTLIIKKDNPSGLPEHDAELRIPVNF